MTRKVTLGGVAALGLVAIVAAGCGTQQVSTSQFMTVNQSAKTVEFKVLAGTGLPQSTTTIDGQPIDHLAFNIPVGYKVTMDFVNQAAFPESMGIYNGHRLAFPNSGESYSATLATATGGLLPGQSQTFTFTANRTGQYALSDILWGGNDLRPVSNVADPVNVTSSGTPSITTQS